MKRILSVVLVAVVVCLFVACGSIEVEYYSNTEVPTFTCVTDVECAEEIESFVMSSYVYSCDENKKESLAEKYVNYLKKECGYVQEEADSVYDYAVKLVNGDSSVYIFFNMDNDKITVMPI